ncbi:MAG: hypothetical protein ACRD1S_06560 [Vicinamibacterales bacterium]
MALLVPPVAGQSLADLARQGQDGQKTTSKAPEKPDKKVYRNSDLGPGGPAPAAQPSTRADTKDAGQPPAPKPPQQGEVRDEAWWRNRINAARADLQRNQLFLEALQSRVNALSTDLVNRDDPVQRAGIGTDRQRALAEMERVRGDVDKLKKQIVEIEEEARVAGVPPGWLR